MTTIEPGTADVNWWALSGDEVSCTWPVPSHLTIQMSVLRLSFSASMVVTV